MFLFFLQIASFYIYLYSQSYLVCTFYLNLKALNTGWLIKDKDEKIEGGLIIMPYQTSSKMETRILGVL